MNTYKKNYTRKVDIIIIEELRYWWLIRIIIGLIILVSFWVLSFIVMIHLVPHSYCLEFAICFFILFIFLEYVVIKMLNLLAEKLSRKVIKYLYRIEYFKKEKE